ncbi:Unconventional myosin tail [Monocercomonoides exilis]|uniref:Unconventional myosin tail n=1 Tax=Monocercomonoides exilis TaxID=2049356 RepID=UPI003559E65F|nr:Unconventional myosin tail [Monocercomonoides exilis]|eukprot:MONOS_4303.1-p1 / transcript=MONOS_4303.1 / gene=MONOS_4303 / organism=Monocercomonoides_exilis_PA203 / gene_product=Unconventional myosin tail / transcript_product=Unconventional myosin tail / location=Mono_scaffold00112:114151-115839(-) / protein_length=375 / sequence_SO=supercontig / SO=protein_coding / is_pseudo=false
MSHEVPAELGTPLTTLGSSSITPGESPFFMGMKERRRSSDTKAPLGDLLKLKLNSSVMKMIGKTGDTDILFSDEIVKVNKRLKTQKRILLITDLAVYNLTPGNFKLKRRIALQDLGSVNLSCLSDNFFALRVPTEYDYLMVSTRKIEIVLTLVEAYKKHLHSDLPVNFSNAFEYRIDEKTIREIRFIEVDGGVSTQIYTKNSISFLFSLQFHFTIVMSIIRIVALRFDQKLHYFSVGLLLIAIYWVEAFPKRLPMQFILQSISSIISIFNNLLLCFFQLYMLSSLGDLEGDIIDPRELCKQLNPTLMIETLLQCITVIILFVGKRTFPLNQQTIRKPSVLRSEIHSSYHLLLCSAITFFWGFACLVLDLVCYCSK